MAEQSLNLHQKLALIRDIADVAVKNRKGYKYTYADLAEILSKVKAGMKKYHVLLLTPMVPGTADIVQNVYHNTKVAETGEIYEQVVTEMLFSCDITFTWVDCDNPEDRIDAPWFITASMPDPAQALGSACSYGERQFLTTYFQIPQVEDVDAYRSKQREAEDSENIAMAEKLIGEADYEIKDHLASHPDQTEAVRNFAKRYAKNGDYFKIKDPKLAAKFLKEFMDTFKSEDKPKEG